MRYCPSCLTEAGSYHLPSCENPSRDAKGRFWPGPITIDAPTTKPPLFRCGRSDMDEQLQNADEGDER